MNDPCFLDMLSTVQEGFLSGAMACQSCMSADVIG
jgi:hypothetical protein